MEPDTLQKIRDFKLNLQLNKLKQKNLEVESSSLKDQMDKIKLGNTKSILEDNLATEMDKKHDPNKNAQSPPQNNNFSDHLEQVRLKVHNFIKKTSHKSSLQKKKTHNVKLCRVLLKVFKRSLNTSFYRLNHCKIQVRDSFNSFEDFEEVCKRIKERKTEEIEEMNLNHSLSDITPTFHIEHSEYSSNVKPSTYRTARFNYQTNSRDRDTNNNATTNNSSKDKENFFSCKQSSSRFMSSERRSNHQSQGSEHNSPKLFRTLNDRVNSSYKKIHQLNIPSNKLTYSEKIEKDKKLYSVRRRKLLNFNSYSCFYNILVRFKEKKDQNDIQMRFKVFNRWREYIIRFKKTNKKYEGARHMINILTKHKTTSLVFAMNKILKSNVSLKLMVSNKRHRVLLQCKLNILDVLFKNKLKIVKNNYFNQWVAHLSEMLNEERNSIVMGLMNLFKSMKNIIKNRLDYSFGKIKLNIDNQFKKMKKKNKASKLIYYCIKNNIKNKYNTLISSINTNYNINNKSEENFYLKLIIFNNVLSKILNRSINRQMQYFIDINKFNNSLLDKIYKLEKIYLKNKFNTYKDNIKSTKISKIKYLRISHQLQYLKSIKNKSKAYNAIKKEFYTISNKRIQIKFKMQSMLNNIVKIYVSKSKLQLYKYFHKYYQIINNKNQMLSPYSSNQILNLNLNESMKFIDCKTTDKVPYYLESACNSLLKTNLSDRHSLNYYDLVKDDFGSINVDRNPIRIQGYQMVINILQRTFRRMFNTLKKNSIDIGYSKVKKMQLNNITCLNIQRILKTKMKQYFNLIEMKSKAILMEKVIKYNKIDRIIKLIRTNHYIVKNNAFNKIYKQSTMRKISKRLIKYKFINLRKFILKCAESKLNDYVKIWKYNIKSYDNISTYNKLSVFERIYNRRMNKYYEIIKSNCIENKINKDKEIENYTSNNQDKQFKQDKLLKYKQLSIYMKNCINKYLSNKFIRNWQLSYYQKKNSMTSKMKAIYTIVKLSKLSNSSATHKYFNKWVVAMNQVQINSMEEQISDMYLSIYRQKAYKSKSVSIIVNVLNQSQIRLKTDAFYKINQFKIISKFNSSLSIYKMNNILLNKMHDPEFRKIYAFYIWRRKSQIILLKECVMLLKGSAQQNSNSRSRDNNMNTSSGTISSRNKISKRDSITNNNYSNPRLSHRKKSFLSPEPNAKNNWDNIKQGYISSVHKLSQESEFSLLSPSWRKQERKKLLSISEMNY